MTRFAHGLIVGKFYPPHVGHHRLIDWAASQCETLTVLAMAAGGESLALSDRVAWLEATHTDCASLCVVGVHCDAPVDFEDPIVWAAQEEVMRAALRVAKRPPVDAVFSSEAYGAELARRLSATNVEFDPERRGAPISSSRIRLDAPSCWDFLAPATQAGLAVRVVLLGAESTGTTTIAERLTAHYRRRGGIWQRTQCVAEYGREFTNVKWERARAAARATARAEPSLDAIEWTAADFDLIAAEQTRREEDAARHGSPVLICDTDALATSVWERRYLGAEARRSQAWAGALLPRRDLYLLTSHDDVPWQDDGMREGDLAIREVMTGWFEDALTEAGRSWMLLSGNLDERLSLAVRTIDSILRRRLTFGPAITDIAAQAAETG
jgi:HTH-type transcriptional repressor of NAD biosynthesis genes